MHIDRRLTRLSVQILLSITLSTITSALFDGFFAINVVSDVLTGRLSLISTDFIWVSIAKVIAPTMLGVWVWLNRPKGWTNVVSYLVYGVLLPISVLYGVMILDVPIEPKSWKFFEHVKVATFSVVLSLTLASLPTIWLRHRDSEQR
jgi:hypothetical protein